MNSEQVQNHNESFSVRNRTNESQQEGSQYEYGEEFTETFGERTHQEIEMKSELEFQDL